MTNKEEGGQEGERGRRGRGEGGEGAFQVGDSMHRGLGFLNPQ